MSQSHWRSYVAIGDSFTEGLDDPHPDGSGYRGWADLVAARLAAEHRRSVRGRPAAEEQPDFRYANLAIRGRLFDPIVDDQVPEALRMQPDLVSFAAGGNDVLRRRFDPDRLTARFDEVVRTLRASGADVVIFRFADLTKRLPGAALIRDRVELLNRMVGEVSQRHGAYLVDLWRDGEFANPALWSVDRLHLAEAGHRRVAAHTLTALGLTPDESWTATVPVLRHGFVARRRSDAVWVGHHLAPWIKRRLTGRSSGDHVSAKRPALAPLAPTD